MFEGEKVSIPVVVLPIEPDESTASHDNRNSPFAFRSRMKYADADARVSRLFPAAIERHAPGLLKLKSFDEILMGHTHFPLFSPYLTESQRAKLRLHYKEASQPAVAHMTGMARFQNVAGGYHRICKACVVEDEKRGRVPIWRRASLLPGLLHCPRHKVRYHEWCGRCVNGFKHSFAVRALGQSCSCGEPLQLPVPMMSASGEGAAIRVSEFVQCALDGHLRHFSRDELQNTYRRRARELGLTNAIGIANSYVMAKVLRDTGVAEFANALGFKAGPRDLFGRCVRGKSFNTNPILNALVQSALFPGPNAFLEAASKRTEPSSVENDKVRRRLAIVKDVVLKACRENPGTTRTEIHGIVHYRDMKLLIEHENEWLEKCVPRCGKNEGRHSILNVPCPHIDGKTATHVEHMYEQLISAPELPRITQRRLLIGCPGAGVYSKRKYRMPNAAGLIERYSETKDMHSLRRIRKWLPHIPFPERLSHQARLALIRKWRGES
ncbi:hypothetical protein CBM2633_U20015 [Cupriavidus taiwanensis]|uniref:hypothetical protein n=1 Tax=Cupriavidus taiwanensis TaxID=164546 RepID=UPI000E134680|nr:hypothetical protein [Cupriavidus taiwanensis]SPA23814.1 hypothetical protein CBM2633_U20015 [Cupriavidus taiwanensis]